MPQETNLNVSPYFDDFDPQKNYYKVLFKPGYPVQARELTGLQSILQNQIEQFGNHVFKEGSEVIPGGISYTSKFSGIVLENSLNGIDIDSYIDNLLFKRIVGQSSGVRARIEYIFKKNTLNNPNTVLYLNYLNESGDSKTFSDSENLIVEEDIIPGFSNLTSIRANQVFARTLSTNSNIFGSAVSLSSEGVYFLRGYFITVPPQTLILDYNSIRPTYKVGFTVSEEIVNYDIDNSLVDNAKGFSNYAAPGADRFKITATLSKFRYDEQPGNFIEILRIRNGSQEYVATNPQYNELSKEFARRTYDESGDYYVKPFTVDIRNSLNDGKDNNGIFNFNQTTYQNNVPSENLGAYLISPGKAYVRGYEAEMLSSTITDFEKPRTTKTLENQSIIYSTGATYSLNRVYGSPSLGIGTYYVSLRDSRVGINQHSAPGKEIGVARVYDFALESGSYESTIPDTNQWDISLYDIQTYTEISLNEPITLQTPIFIKGKSSGATGFLRYDASNSGIITAYNVSGIFAKGEKFIFDGIENNRIATSIKSYGTNDVQSLYGLVGTSYTFTADTKQYPTVNVGSVNITSQSGGISTVTSSNFNFIGIATVGNLVSFSQPGITTSVFAKIASVSEGSITITGITTVTGICEGKLPSSNITPSDFKLLKSRFLTSTDNTLYTPIGKKYISSVDLLGSQLIIKKQFEVTISSNSITVPSTELLSNEAFLPFDEERYVLIRKDGVTEPLSSDKFLFTSGGRELTINGLTASSGQAKLIATLQKRNIKSRVKYKNRVNSIIVDKSIYNYSGTNSGAGNTTINDGLVYGNYPYGTRIQDQEICLNVPEVTKLYAIFESSGSQDPTAPSIVLENISTVSTSSVLIGEEIIGENSGAVAICLEKSSSFSVKYVSLNDRSFIDGENILFKESNVTASINQIISGSNDIKNNYSLDGGQKSTILDYSKIIKKTNSFSPTKKLKIYFESAYIPDSDNGDITVVDSYNQFNYCSIQSINNNRISDIIDVRPIVSQFNSNAVDYSPFEFFGRVLNITQSSSLNILASDEAIICNYSFYLGRIDRIYLSVNSNTNRISQSYTKRPVIVAKQGVPSESPQLPDNIDDALEIARVFLPPYLCNVKEASITLIDNKRYTMSDISRLENRIKNVEFYTTLTLLENNAKNLQIKDAQQLDRFKSGIFVDNFTTTSSQNKITEVKNSIDVINSELRPSPFTTEIDLVIGSRSLIGIGTQPPSEVDVKYVTDLIGNNIRRSSVRNANSTGKGIITLDYNEVLEISQQYATRIENVTPYLVTSYYGTIELNPSSDIWVDQIALEPLTVEGISGEITYTQVQLNASQVNQQSGWSPILWNSWVNNWTGLETNSATSGNSTTISTTLTGQAVRTGTSSRTIETFSNISLGSRVVNVDVSPFMRSRNIEFNAKKLKPFSRLYAFFDGQDVNNFIIPKLIEIEMLEGVFIPNEIISSSTFKARCASANHRYGPFANPTDIFIKNPYNQSEDLPSSYSTNSTVLNIDTTSLSDLSSFDFSGSISVGMLLNGESSGSLARVTNIRLISDRSGVVIGSFFVPNPNIQTNPKYKTGTKTLKLTTNQFNSPLAGELLSQAESNFYSSGTLTTTQETILSVRNLDIQTATVSENQAITQTTNTTFTTTPPSPPQPPQPPGGGNDDDEDNPEFSGPNAAANQAAWEAATGYTDPLAQSFRIGDDKDSVGRYVTSIDLYFQSKDDELPVIIQLRSVSLGIPTNEIYPFSTVTVEPENINVSDDASIPTRINFSAPVFLEGNKEHALVVLSDARTYNLWISRMGEIDVSTSNGLESSQIFVTSQTVLGSLFKSQNTSVWTPSQYEDIKFNLYSARFVSDGSINFFNPELNLSNRQIATLNKDSLQITSRNIRVGLGTTVSSNLSIGNLITQDGSNATGYYVGVGGSAVGQLQVLNAGIGYTPSIGSLTYNNVSLTSVTGSGRDAKANITISNGVAIAATISIGGTGYTVGEVLTAESIGINSLGRNLRLSVVGIGQVNELILDNIQGDFIVGVGKTLYYQSSEVGVGRTPINGGGVYITSTPIVRSDGLHMKVNHNNHGMHSLTNSVIISNAKSDIDPARLTQEYSSTSNSSILLSPGFSTSFLTFENIGVGQTNPGYVLIDGEIISYTGVSNNNLTGIVRGIDSTQITTHQINSLVYKYELGGVSLRRINKKHDLQDAEINNPIGLDYYTIKVGMNTNGVDRTDGTSIPKLYFNSSKLTGGESIQATQNIPFEIARPITQTVVHPRTKLSAEIRTTSGTSVSGSEISFESQGFEPISLSQNNYFSTPRIVASKVNETEKLNDSLANKSMEVRFNLSTSDSRLTPVIDLDRMGMILVSNRVNNVIENYADDIRVSTLRDDPSAFVYATKAIPLEIPANSIKVIVSAYINPYSDLRAFYSILKDTNEDPIYYPFPGYSNIIRSEGFGLSNQVINIENSDGSSDVFVSKNQSLGFESNDITFKDYEFTIDNLESFRYFSIKLIGTSTNQCYPPRLRDLRVIAVA
jgi:hypothetical protein